jgi:hypothetical protein
MGKATPTGSTWVCALCGVSVWVRDTPSRLRCRTCLQWMSQTR